MWFKVVVFVSFLVLGLCRDWYRNDFPNGFAVPNPCGDPTIWGPVGHYNPEHHTQRKNPFGLALAGNSHNWAAICGQDSDGDGKSNGEELGDPNCVWTKGTAPQFKASSHPGICEPIGDPKCHEQSFFRCGCFDHCHH